MPVPAGKGPLLACLTCLPGLVRTALGIRLGWLRLAHFQREQQLPAPGIFIRPCWPAGGTDGHWACRRASGGRSMRCSTAQGTSHATSWSSWPPTALLTWTPLSWTGAPDAPVLHRQLHAAPGCAGHGMCRHTAAQQCSACWGSLCRHPRQLCSAELRCGSLVCLHMLSHRAVHRCTTKRYVHSWHSQAPHLN